MPSAKFIKSMFDHARCEARAPLEAENELLRSQVTLLLDASREVLRTVDQVESSEIDVYVGVEELRLAVTAVSATQRPSPVVDAGRLS